MQAFAIVGYSNSGKTTLIEKLIPHYRSQGLAVSAIKNAHHGFDMDHEGKDSYRYRAAGASQVLIATGKRWALLTETPAQPASLEQLLAQIAPCDLVLVEGFKSDGQLPRLEIRRADCHEPCLFKQDNKIVALVTDATEAPADLAQHTAGALPHFHRDETVKIADFILSHLSLSTCTPLKKR